MINENQVHTNTCIEWSQQLYSQPEEGNNPNVLCQVHEYGIFTMGDYSAAKRNGLIN